MYAAHTRVHTYVYVYTWSPAGNGRVRGELLCEKSLPTFEEENRCSTRRRRPKVTVRELAQLVFKTLLLHLSKYNTLEFRGMMHEATILSRTVDDLARVSANSSLQTTLHDYFLFVNTAYS